MKLHYPLTNIHITQHFGERPEVYKPYLGHTGIDLRTKTDIDQSGKVPVFAAAEGRVEIGDQGEKGYGKFVRITHPDGSQTVYGHLSAWKVDQKQTVKTGDQIGIAGNTGFSSAPHLHFGYRPAEWNQNNGYAGYVDPLPFLEQQIMAPYFEQKIGQPAICYLDSATQTLVPFSDGAVFKDLFGSYEKVAINKVEEWTLPISNNLLGLYEKTTSKS